MSMNVCPNDFFRTAQHFVTKPGVVMQHHKPECPVEKLDYSIQGQGHGDQNVSVVHMISSKPPNILLPNLVL